MVYGPLLGVTVNGGHRGPDVLLCLRGLRGAVAAQLSPVLVALRLTLSA